MTKGSNRSTGLAAALIGAACLPVGAQAEDTGNRYGYPRDYHSEISAARAFADTVAVRGKWGAPSEHPIVIDVRGIDEYAYGHPEGALSIPYPRIYRECTERYADGNCKSGTTHTEVQTDAAFVDYVQQVIKDKDRPIYTLCRTGARSVLAANLLAAAGYTNVRNIWEGFVGQYKTYEDSGPMDVDNDGALTDNDKDGWRNYQKLPYDTRLLPQALYAPYAYKYYEFQQ